MVLVTLYPGSSDRDLISGSRRSLDKHMSYVCDDRLSDQHMIVSVCDMYVTTGCQISI